MRLAAAAVVATAACGFPTPSREFACTTQDDCLGHPGTVCSPAGYCIASAATIDAFIADVPLPMTCTDWPKPSHFDPCLIGPIPTTGLDLLESGQYTYDTTTGELRDPSRVVIAAPQPMLVDGSQLLSVGRLTLGASATLRVVGDWPLIVASWTTIEVAGTIDVSSRSMSLGAGANPADCASHPPTIPPDHSPGGGGGGGGGFQGVGGTGGIGNQNSTDQGAPGVGGDAVALPSRVLGGCSGSNGAKGNVMGGTSGAGGGAIQLTARGVVVVSGTVHAGGGGGRGAPFSSYTTDPGSGGGGGGGGSGGMIGIEAPTVEVPTGATLAANGGAGGEGTDSNPPVETGPVDGANGQDGLASITRATCDTQSAAGEGGDGSGDGVLDGGEGAYDRTDGGGGGGGGAGFIVIRSPAKTLAGTISPPATTP